MTWPLDAAGTQRPAVRLRHMIEEGAGLVVPGAFSPLAAIMARRTGFRAAYFSGATFSAAMGLPDVGMFTLDELATGVRWTARASDLPLIVDADTGFGGPLNVVRTVRELEEAGAAAVQIEDQEMPKRCGHLEGKTVIPAEAFVGKVRAAVQTRRDLVIVARTDARSTHGLDEAIRRAKLYREAGADVIFPEALESEEEFRIVAKEVGGPLLANMTEFGKSPYLPASRLHALGYNLVIFPGTAFRVAMKAAQGVYEQLAATGTQTEWLDLMQTRSELYELIEYSRYDQLDKELSGES